MRAINLIVIHCSASRADRCYTGFDLKTDHKRRGFITTGYHFYIRKDGKIITTRSLELDRAHAKGYTSIPSASVTKGELMVKVSRQIPARPNRYTL